MLQAGDKLLNAAYDHSSDTFSMGFRPDLEAGINVCQEKTLTAASTDYTIAVPDNARLAVINPTARIRVAMEAIGAASVVAGSGDAVGVGRFCAPSVDTPIVLPAGTGRTLHLRSTSAGAVAAISFLP